jgi:hypothetical protein
MTSLRKRGHFEDQPRHRISNKEWSGALGLSFDLIMRATNGTLNTAYCRAKGGSSTQPYTWGESLEKHRKGPSGRRAGVADWPNTWPTKIQLLFDFENGFDPGAWGKYHFRDAFRRCYDRLRAHAFIGPGLADSWRSGIGEYGALGFITAMPQYEKSRLYHAALHPHLPEGTGKKIRWWLARPNVPHPRNPESSESESDKSITQELMEARLARRAGHDHAPYNRECEDRALEVGWMALTFQAKRRGWDSCSFPEDDLDDIRKDDRGLMQGRGFYIIESFTNAYIVSPEPSA